MIIVQTYNTCHRQMKHLLAEERITRTRNMAWLQTGMLHSRSVHLGHIANKIPGWSKKRSRVRRLERYLDNGQVRVRAWYEPTARQLLAEAARTGQWLRLLIDSTRVGNGHQLLMVALAYRRRALPLAWTWVRAKRGHSSGGKQSALLAYIRQLIPAQAPVVVIGDSEFTPLQALLTDWGWYYALRQKGSHRLRLNHRAPWQRCDTLLSGPGQRRWLSQIQLTQKYAHPTNLLALWQRGQKSPWLIATNLPDPRQTRQLYSRRMWVDEMFGDFKEHGFDLEATRLRHFLRLSRLTLAVALLYVWLLAFGSQTIKQGKRHLVDRTDRRDLSVFRTGFDMFERCVINGLSFSIRLVPYFL